MIGYRRKGGIVSTRRTRRSYGPSTYRRAGIALVVLVTLAALYGAVADRPGGPIVSTVALGQPLSSDGLVVGTTPGRAVVATIGTGQPGSAGDPPNRIDILNVGDGALQRAVPVDGGALAVAVDRRGMRIFVTDVSTTVAAPAQGVGVLRALDGASGAQLRAVSFNTQPMAAAVDGRAGRVFVVGGGSGGWAGGICWRDPDVLRMFDARTLRLLRTVPLDRDPRGVMVDEPSGRVFATTMTGVWVLDARTGRVVRKVNGVRRVLAVDAHTRRAFVALTRGGVRMLDTTTGRDMGPAAVEAGIQVADRMPAAVDAATDQVFILDNGTAAATGAPRRGGMVSVLDGASGRLLRAILVGRAGTLPSAIALAPERHEAFVADEVANTVSVLDTRRWRAPRVIGAGATPVALAWDARTGRLLVESINTPDTDRPDAWEWLPSRVRSWLPFIPRQPVAPPAQVSFPMASITVLDPAR